MKFSTSFRLVGMTVLLLFTNPSWPDVIPGSAMPEQVGKGIRAQQPKPEQRVLPPLVTPEEKAPTPGGEAAKKIKFKLNNIILEGNCVYSKATLLVLYKDKLNKVITVAELFDIVQSITNYYRNNGYIISRAILPPQHVKNGVVKVQIIEGFIADVDVTGHPWGARCLVMAFAKKIRQCPPLKLSRMENYLLIANEIPATRVKAVLSPSKRTKGAADLTLVTENRPITGYFSYDNYGTRYIGPLQLTGNLGLNSWFFSGDSFQATVTKTTKGGELTYRDFNYNVALDDNGTRWLIGDTWVHTHPLFVLRPAQIDGINENIYTSFQFPLIRTRSQSLTFYVNLNYLDSHVNTFDVTLYADHLRSLGLGLSYNFADEWYGANSIYADVRQGLPVLGYTSDTSAFALTSRPGGRGDYTKIDFQISRLQGIKNLPISFYVMVKGQYAFNPLLASEQFAFGGSILGRGYDVAEIISDKALAGTAELRYDWSPPKIIQAIQFYIYYDAGVFWNYHTPGISFTKLSATSTGAGARFYFTKYISGNVMWTQVLTKPIAAEQLIGDGNRPRVFFSVVFSFP